MRLHSAFARPMRVALPRTRQSRIGPPGVARLGVVAALALGALLPLDTAAQAVLKGRIRAAQSHAPIALVEVLLDNLRIRAWTNDSGDFRIANIPLGSHELRVRRVGFESAVATLTVKTSDSLLIDLYLNAWIPELETIYVRAPKQSRFVNEMEERKRLGLGKFLLPDDLRENEHRLLSDLVRELGIEVQHTAMGNKAIAIGNRTPTISNSASKCIMRIYVNGNRVDDEDLNRYRVSELDGVEVYRRTSETPVRYTMTAVGTPQRPRPGQSTPPDTGGEVCGVVVLWTRNH